ncbi:DNA polymerase delta, subunit 4-domain-containing protein [Podospora appendiculata]|uniref:DNA polymerase delta, subunit 4-domain-containing protein n=1 Tax=Podospora appendiculata TaxID=314037 RepID=A0AAE1C8T9_9PEZI|nr:DNA polymerase delta, subunit 4-domain-containing protein [Podospora appendiculata]
MPTTRKSSRLSDGASSAGPKQSTLSFNHRVTKAAPKSAKDSLAKASSLSKEYRPETETETEQPKTEDISEPASPQEVVTEPTPEVVEKSEIECKAEKVSDAAIERYWSKIEAARSARAVHRKHAEGLSTGEKVLRYFDVSSQYGPCIGIARRKRWQRAEKLGLNPPIEVLAVLVKEEARSELVTEKAHMDVLMNSTAAGDT